MIMVIMIIMSIIIINNMIIMITITNIDWDVSVLPSIFQGYCLKYNVKGAQFEETKTQIFVNLKFIQ